VPARLWHWHAVANSWRLPFVPNPWLSLFAVERRPSPLAEKRFWRPVAANLWLSLFAAERRLSPLAEKRFWWPAEANLWRSGVAIKRQGSPGCYTTD
jgi:hypothetical protein